MDGSGQPGDRRELARPDLEADPDVRAAVAAMVRASRTVAEAAEAIAAEAKRVVEMSREASELEVGAARRSISQSRGAHAGLDTEGRPARGALGRNPRMIVTIGSALLVLVLIGAVSLSALRDIGPRVPDLLSTTAASLSSPAAPMLAPMPPAAAPLEELPVRQSIPSHLVPPGVPK